MICIRFYTFFECVKRDYGSILHFLSGAFSRFDSDVARNRRRLVQSNIATVLTAMQSMVKDGRKYVSSVHVYCEGFILIARLDEVHEELLYYPRHRRWRQRWRWRRRLQNVNVFTLKFFM